jgi:penicillin-binding protein 1A
VRHHLWYYPLLLLVILGVVADIALLVLQIGLPSTQQVIDLKLPQATQIITEDGIFLGEFYQDRRRWLQPHKLTTVMRNAFVAAHDPTFYQRAPLGLRDLLNAYLVKGGPRADGHPGGLAVPLAYASLPPPKSFFDHVRVWLLARRLEGDLSKQDLVSLYLNRANFGEGGYGVEEAALHFFGRHAEELQVGEIAILSSILPRPSARSPMGYPELALKRRDQVLDDMLAQNLLDPETVKKAKDEPLKLGVFKPPYPGVLAAVRSLLRKKFGKEKLATGGYTVVLSLDPKLQDKVLKAARNAALTADEANGWRGELSNIDGGLYAKVRDAALHAHDGTVDLGPALPLLATGDVARIAAACRVAPPAADAVVVGRVSKVDRDSALVEVGSFSVRLDSNGASWALESVPASGRSLDHLLHVGDTVMVRVMSLSGMNGKQVPGRLEQRSLANAAALVAEWETGRVLAMVGGVPGSNPIDRSRNLVRSVGAGASIITYAVGLESGKLTAATMLQRPAGLSPTLWDGDGDTSEAAQAESEARSRSPLTAAEAFATHDVGGHAAALALADPAKVDAALKQIGFGHNRPEWLSRGALGNAWDLTLLWAMLANDGKSEPLHLVSQVVDATGKVIYAPSVESSTVLSPKTTHVVQEWVALANGGQTMASHLGRDTWYAGESGSWVGATWVGPDANGPLKNIKSSGPAEALYKIAMGGQKAAKPTTTEISLLNIDPDSGLLAKTGGLTAAFAAGTEPTEFAKVMKPHTPKKGRH